jgi:hypothetical protein
MGSSSNVDATRIAARIQDLSSEPVLLLRINGEMRVAASARMSPEASNLFPRTVLRDQNTSAGQPDYLTYLLPIVRQLPKGQQRFFPRLQINSAFYRRLVHCTGGRA